MENHCLGLNWPQIGCNEFEAVRWGVCVPINKTVTAALLFLLLLLHIFILFLLSYEVYQLKLI